MEAVVKIHAGSFQQMCKFIYCHAWSFLKTCISHPALRPISHHASIPISHHASIPISHHAFIPISHHAFIPISHHAALRPISHHAALTTCLLLFIGWQYSLRSLSIPTRISGGMHGAAGGAQGASGEDWTAGREHHGAAPSGGLQSQGVDLIRITRKCYDQTVRQVQVRVCSLLPLTAFANSQGSLHADLCAGTTP